VCSLVEAVVEYRLILVVSETDVVLYRELATIGLAADGAAVETLAEAGKVIVEVDADAAKVVPPSIAVLEIFALAERISQLSDEDDFVEVGHVKDSESLNV
jgi:hypothetical protein